MSNPPTLLAVCLAGLLACSGPVLADKPSWAGGGKHDKHDDRSDERHDGHRHSSGPGYYFDDDVRYTLRDYYGRQASAGQCPPGLAKKHNGCQPPGQAKKWRKGQALPADLRYYDLPHELLLRLPPPPPRHRYVQVAGDVLLIAIGSSMVIDAVEDLLR